MLKFEPKQNIVFFSVDTRRKDLYSTYSDGVFKTPNLERMAKRGIVFNNMYSTSASTVMSLSSLISGRWCHDFERSNYPERQPHEFADTMFSDFQNKGRENYILFDDRYLKDYADGIYRGPHAKRVRANYESARDAVETVISIARNATAPFCIFSHNSLGGAAVEEEDEALGYLLDNLDLNTTTLVFYSDHGYLMGEHANLFFHAFFLYEQVIRVPCIITADEPQVVDESDTLAQLRDLMGGEVIEPLQYLFADTQYRAQRHRVTSIYDTENNWKYIAHYSHKTAVTGRQEELYDLSRDPGEHRNLLFDRAQHPIRPDWNTSNVSDIVAMRDDYRQDELLAIANRMRSQIAVVWLDGFLSHLSQTLEPNGRSIVENRPDFVERLVRMDPQHQMAIVSNYFDYEQPTTGAYRRPEFSIGFPSLPTNFLEFA